MKLHLNESLFDPWKDDNISFFKELETVSDLIGSNVVYHATYKPYWEEIKKEGFIKPGKHQNWGDAFKTKYNIYLSKDYYNALSYAETAEEVPEELLNQIVVLEIDANKLDVDHLDPDNNQVYDYDGEVQLEDPLTWVELQYDLPIPVSAVKKVHDESELDEAIETAEDPKTKPFQQQIDQMDGNIKITLYDAKNGHNYGEEYLEDLFHSNKKLCSKMLVAIQIFKELGRNTPTKYSKYLRDGIFELRASVATNEARELYFFSVGGNEVVITNGFTKKTQTTPDRAIEKAKNLMKEYFNQQIND